MLKKLKFILMFISLSISLCLMSNTYSRYVSDTTGNIEMTLAKWQMLVNTIDITNSNQTNINFQPIIEENANIANNTFAPSSKGYFDIEINPNNVDVSFKYSINLNVENTNMPDVSMIKYALLPIGFIEGDPLTLVDITNNIITDSLYYDNITENFEFNIITIRIYFEWFEGIDELMDDNADTVIGLDAATNNTTLNLSADILFEQIIE